MNRLAPRILCVEVDPSLAESRCAILGKHGYQTVSASFEIAQNLLGLDDFALIVASYGLAPEQRSRLARLAGRIPILVLDGMMVPSELLAEVADRLPRRIA